MKNTLKRLISTAISLSMIISIASLSASAYEQETYIQTQKQIGDTTVTELIYLLNETSDEVVITLIEYTDGVRDAIVFENGVETKISNVVKDGYSLVESFQETEMTIDPRSDGYTYKTTEYYSSYQPIWTLSILTGVIAAGLGLPPHDAVSLAVTMIGNLTAVNTLVYFKHTVEGKQEWNGSRLVFKYRLNNYWSYTGYFSNTFYAGISNLESLDPIWG